MLVLEQQKWPEAKNPFFRELSPKANTQFSVSIDVDSSHLP